VFDRRYGSRRHKTWIDVAKAAIAGDHVRRARLGAGKFAIPHHVAGAEILHRAPRRIAEAAGMGGANAESQSGRGQYESALHGSSLGRREVEARRGRHRRRLRVLLCTDKLHTPCERDSEDR
jgi:hypothetical protein